MAKKENLLELNVSLNLNLTDRLADTTAFRRLANFYSRLRGNSCTAAEAVSITYAQLILFGTLCPFGLCAGWRACVLLLTVGAIKNARLWR